MDEGTGLKKLIHQNAARQAAYAEVFARVSPEGLRAQDALFQKRAKDYEVQRKKWASMGQPTGLPFNHSAKKLAADRFERLQHQIAGERAFVGPNPQVRSSRLALAMALQPVRDLVIDDIPVLSQDQQLDIIGFPYLNTWTSKSGEIDRPLENQMVWANQSDGSFGFEHRVEGTVTGKQFNSGAGFFVSFVPRITPGIAEIRPYLPYSYAWSTLSFISREDNSATFGIRVWSWDNAGNNMTTELDYHYFAWNITSISEAYYTNQSPSWYGPPVGFDYDTAFVFGNESPYFQVRPNRVYMAAIWCSGLVWSVSPENRAGDSDRRLHATMPLVVIGYQ